MHIKPVKLRGGGVVYAFAHPAGNQKEWVVSIFNGSGAYTGGRFNPNGGWTQGQARAEATRYRRWLRKKN